jgi:nucleoside-diphosphate-sugar epimerase
MKILVTGCMGYVGPAVVSELQHAHPEATIIGLDAGWFFQQVDGGPRFPEFKLDAVLFMDIRDVTPDLLQGVTHIVHLAAVSNDPMGQAFQDVTESINGEATMRLAKHAKDAGVRRFVFASSASVYGYGDSSPRSETSEVGPLTTYAQLKLAVEEELKDMSSSTFQTTALRFATACGWSPRIRLDLVLNDFVASAITTGKIQILSDGRPWRPLISVPDMARAVGWAVSDERDEFGSSVVVNVGCDEWNYRIIELAQEVAGAIDNVDVIVNSAAPADKRSYRVDFALWRSIAPNHQPQNTLVETILSLKTNLSEIRDLAPDFRNSDRVRLRRLKALQDADLLDERLRWTNA